MKHVCFTTLSLCLLTVVMQTSCSDDPAYKAPNVSPDINVPITGYWQIAGEDINGDGAIQGIVVHNDKTVTEWMYTRLTRQSPWRSLTKTPTIFNGLSFKFATFATWNIKQT